MNIVIVTHDSPTQKTIQQSLLKEGKFDGIEAFSSAEQAAREAQWDDTEILLTTPELRATRGPSLIHWVHTNYPHIVSLTHSLHDNNKIVYSCV